MMVKLFFFFYSSTETESKMVSDKPKKRVTSMSFNKHLGDRKAWCFHIYYTGVTSFGFSNCVKKNEA